MREVPQKRLTEQGTNNIQIEIKDNDLKLILLFYLFTIPIALHGSDFGKGMLTPILDTLVFIVFSFIALYVIVFKLFAVLIPQKRFLTLFVLVVIFLIILGIFETLCYKVIGNHTWVIKNKLNFVMAALDSSVENTGMLIAIFVSKKFYDSQLDLEIREREKRESELRLLKSQIDPHFLFNNLNTVDSLISSQPQVAKSYINKLSNLYRYLIRTKDDEVVPLEDELSFAKDYIFLLEKRFGKAYQLDLHVNVSTSDLLIPPGALQTLLENVVKHNIGDENDPIIANILVETNQITVSNSIKPKQSNKDSNGTGLLNLKARYNLLSDKNIQIESTNQYKVVLPILKAVS